MDCLGASGKGSRCAPGQGGSGRTDGGISAVLIFRKRSGNSQRTLRESSENASAGVKIRHACACCFDQPKPVCPNSPGCFSSPACPYSPGRLRISGSCAQPQSASGFRPARTAQTASHLRLIRTTSTGFISPTRPHSSGRFHVTFSKKHQIFPKKSEKTFGKSNIFPFEL